MVSHYPQLVSDGDRYRFALDFVQKHETVNPSVNPDAVSCENLLLVGGTYYCIWARKNHIPRWKELISLEVCKICLVRAENWKKRALAPPPSPSPVQNEWNEMRKDKTKDFKHYGMTFCEDAGMWVYPSKCPLCKQHNFPVYDACQKRNVATASIPQPKEESKP